VVGGAVAQAQELTKAPRIGYIAGRTPSTDADVEPIRLALRKLGYIEGQNIVIEYRYTDGNSIGPLSSWPISCVLKLI
jgi:hypothetical protein